LQAEAIQNMLRSSLSPSDIPTCCQNCANIVTFAQGLLATNILYDQLVDYVWGSYLVKAQQDNQKKVESNSLQKEWMVYSHDADHNIAGAEDRMLAWDGLDLSQN